jgi:pimeloyl-ACP methyl ester carboxylesterase
LASDCRALESLGQELNTFTSVIPQIAQSGSPAHVLYGERDDAWSLESQNQMAADLSAPVTVIKGAGHCPNEDQPEVTVSEIVKFWNSVEA